LKAAQSEGIINVTYYLDVHSVRYLAYSPVEPILVCAVSSSDDSTGALLSVNVKTMATEVENSDYMLFTNDCVFSKARLYN
jgi:hypothetical protein